MRFIFLAFILLHFSAVIKAQEENEPTGQAWYYLHNSVFINSRTSYVHDIGFRHSFPAEDLWRIYYRPAIRYSAGDFIDVFGGTAFFSTRESDKPDEFEFRPWQALRIDWPVYGRFHFDHFIRLEERFFRQAGKGNGDPALRARYRLNLTLPLNHHSMKEKTLFLRTNAEFFYHTSLGESPEKQYHRRFGSGLGYKVDLRWTLELLYVFTNSSGIPFDGLESPINVLQVRVRRAIFPAGSPAT